MIRIAIWTGAKPGDGIAASEVKELRPADALHDELVSRLFWPARIEVLSKERIEIKCVKVDRCLDETIVFTEADPHGHDLAALYRVAKCYALASGQCSDPVKELVKRK